MVDYFKRRFSFAEGQNPTRKQTPFHVVLSQEQMSGNMKTEWLFSQMRSFFLQAALQNWLWLLSEPCRFLSVQCFEQYSCSCIKRHHDLFKCVEDLQCAVTRARNSLLLNNQQAPNSTPLGSPISLWLFAYQCPPHHPFQSHSLILLLWNIYWVCQAIFPPNVSH